MGTSRMRLLQPIVALSLTLFAGCSDSPTPQAEVTTGTEKTRNPVEVVKDELHKLSAYVTNGCGADNKYFSDLRSLVVELAASERKEAFRVAKEVIASSKLKEYPLSRRWASLDAYVYIARDVAVLFHDQVEDQEGVWDFLLQSLDILDKEHRIVASVSFDPRNPPMGLIMTTGQYLLRLDSERFYAIRWGFEGEAFGGYYWRLSEDAQKRWKEKIEKVARRKVGFQNPYNPSKSEPRPRRQFNPPPYLPEELREKYRSERHKVLKASGIDPKEEGL